MTTELENQMEYLLVEWWAKPAKEIAAGEMPYQTRCTDKQEALSLEKKFQSIGWTARTVTVRETRSVETHHEDSLDGMLFTVRTRNCLKDARITSLAQLVTWSRVKLLKIPNLGVRSADEISSKLSYYGLHFASETNATCLCDMSLIASHELP